jgi:DNA-binding MarR family transcriptional regulator
MIMPASPGADRQTSRRDDQGCGLHRRAARPDAAAVQRPAAAARRVPGKVPTPELAGRLVSRAPDVTRLLDKLERRGLVARERPADNRRVVRVGITPAGLALLDELSGPVRDCHARQLGHLPAPQLKALVELLRAARAPHEDPDGGWR